MSTTDIKSKTWFPDPNMKSQGIMNNIVQVRTRCYEKRRREAYSSQKLAGLPGIGGWLS